MRSQHEVHLVVIDEKARARWREAQKTQSSGGVSSGVIMIELGMAMMGTRAGRKVLSSWGRK